MTFKLVFSLIQSLIDPDKLTDKKKGFTALITRTLIAIILLGITPTIFREAFNLQSTIVGSDNSENIIYKLVAGKNTKGNFTDLGRVLASDLYFSFFTDNDTPELNGGTLDPIKQDIQDGTFYDRFKTDDYDNLRTSVENGDWSFYDTVDYLTVKTNNQYVIEFDWFLSLGIAIVVIWMFVMYCVQIGVRVVQLAYLQLIAPVPILSYISDPEGSFKKWTHQCLTTYLDIFIRLAIIYFVMTLIGDVLAQFRIADSQIMISTGLSPQKDFVMLNIIKIFILIGLLLFAKKVPDLLKELFPNLGKGPFSFTLNPGKVFKGTLAGSAIGGIVGAGTGAAVGLIGGHGVGGRVKGILGGFTKGAISGAKGKKISEITAARAAQNLKNRQIRDSESTFGGRIDASLRNKFGLESRTAVIDRKIENIDNSDLTFRNQQNSAIISSFKAIKDKATSELEKKDTTVQTAKLRLERKEEMFSKGLITESAVLSERLAYKDTLDAEIKNWVNDASRGGKDVEVQKSMQTIANITKGKVNTYDDAEEAKKKAEDQMVTDVRQVAIDENRKQELSRDKRKAQADENAIKK